MIEHDYAQVKKTIEELSQCDFVYWGSDGLEWDARIRDDYEQLHIEVLMEIAKSNFYPSEDYDPEDCSVRHAIENSLREYCKRMKIGVVCANCGEVDNHEFEIDGFHNQIGRLVDQWGDVEVFLRVMQMMRNPDGSFSSRHFGCQTGKAKRLKFEERLELVFPQRDHEWFYGQLKQWAEFRNAVTHNALVKRCDGNFEIVHFDEIARRKSQHAQACSSPSQMNSLPSIPVINNATVKAMCGRIDFVLRSFDGLVSHIRDAGPCSNFRINGVWEKESVKISATRWCEHSEAEDIVIWHDHVSHYVVESNSEPRV